jgi:hypothetical protein
MADYSLYKNEYRIFKPIETTIRRRLNSEKRNKGDGPIWVLIQIYMEMSQRNSLYSYLKQTKM